jgi:predicted transcriptional regulator
VLERARAFFGFVYIHTVGVKPMKRITVFADEDVLRKLRKIAKRESSSVLEVTRKALVEYVSRRQAKRSRCRWLDLAVAAAIVLCGEI